MKRAASGAFGAACVALLVLGDSRALESVSRALHSSAVAVGEMAEASAMFLSAGANVTSNIATASRKVLGASAEFATEVWRGVDFVGVKAERMALRALAPTREAMTAHCGDPNVSSGLPNNTAPILARCASGVASEMAATTELFQVNASYVSVECRSRVFPSSLVGVTAVVASVRYTVQWANSLWEFMLLDPASDRLQIFEQIQMLLATMDPAVNAKDVGDGAWTTLASFEQRPQRLVYLAAALESAGDLGYAAVALGPYPWLAFASASLLACGLRRGVADGGDDGSDGELFAPGASNDAASDQSAVDAAAQEGFQIVGPS